MSLKCSLLEVKSRRRINNENQEKTTQPDTTRITLGNTVYIVHSHYKAGSKTGLANVILRLINAHNNND